METERVGLSGLSSISIGVPMRACFSYGSAQDSHRTHRHGWGSEAWPAYL